jgi:predicted PurR-regulated permease PerM
MIFVGSVIFLFMLLNGRRYVRWAAGRSGFSPAVIDPVTTDCGSAIRGYFRGTTIIAASNAIPVAITAWLLDVPLVGTIALVTFITASVPFFEAIIAGIFVCLIVPAAPLTAVISRTAQRLAAARHQPVEPVRGGDPS